MIHIIDSIDFTFCKLRHYVDGRPVLKTSQVIANTTCIECYEAVELWGLLIGERVQFGLNP